MDTNGGPKRRYENTMPVTDDGWWESVLAEGHVLTAEITSVPSYGAFARLKVGVEGLIHATEMPLESGQTPRDIFTEGQKIQVRILHVDPAHQRMGLSLQTSL